MERERKEKKTETEREETTNEKTRQDETRWKEKKTEIMMWTDAESKFTQEKAKLAN